MRDELLDIIKQTNGLLECLKVTATATETSIKGCDANKTLFVEATLKNAIPEFEGEFGIPNMTLLNGLLNFANYRTDDAKLVVKKLTRNDQVTVEKIEFINKVTGNESDFRMMDPRHVPDQAVIPQIPWDVTFTPSKSKVTEFAQLANLYSEIDKNFGIRTVNKDLQFFIGGDDSKAQSHRASMIFESNASGELKGNMFWDTGRFLSIMKLSGNNPTTMKVTSRGVLLISVETAHAVYNYFLRADR